VRRAELLGGIVAAIDARLAAAERRGPILVGVDGVDGAGKTTFADEFGAALEAHDREVVRVSLDGFHHPREVRYRRGRSSPEGFFLDSFDLESVRQRLLAPLRTGGDRRIVRAVHDVATDAAVDAPVEQVGEDAVVVVDGLFLHRPELRSVWDLSVFLDVPFEVSVRRMAVRDGSDPDPAAASNRRYVDGQRLYLGTCEPRRHATLVVDNTDLAAPRLVREDR
jgi:uridine kinase